MAKANGCDMCNSLKHTNFTYIEGIDVSPVSSLPIEVGGFMGEWQEVKKFFHLPFQQAVKFYDVPAQKSSSLLPKFLVSQPIGLVQDRIHWLDCKIH